MLLETVGDYNFAADVKTLVEEVKKLNESVEVLRRLAEEKKKDGKEADAKEEPAKRKDYEADIMHRLFIEVMSADSEELSSRPHRKVFDMAIACRMEKDRKRIPVTNAMAKEYGVSPDEIVREAMLDSQNIRPAVLAKAEFGDGSNFPMWVVSNQARFCGAAALFYPGMMKRIEKKIGSGYILIPSSVHEFIIVSDSEKIDADNLAGIISSVNGDGSCISPEEVLLGTPYHYADGVFERLDSYLAEKH